MILEQKTIDAILNFSKQSAHGNFYVYDTSVMRQKIKNLQNILPNSANVYLSLIHI